MNRDVDDVLTEAGARWRAAQPTPPEPDLDRILQPRGPRRWIPVLAAASVAAIAVAALLVLPGEDEPALSVAPSNQKEHPLLVRDGDRVQVQGQVVAAPGAPVHYCLPVVQPLPIELPRKPKPPSCPGDRIEVTGVDVSRLTDASTVLGVTTGQARLVGTWSGGTIAVEEQSAPVHATEPAPPVPCPPPAGGWKPGDASTAITPAVEAFVKARAAQLQQPWIGWPNGYPTVTAPGDALDKPSVVMIGVAHGDLGQIRAAIDPLVDGNLCVTRVRLSQSELVAQQAAVQKLPLRSLNITSVGSGAGDKPITVELRILDERVADAFRPLGLDTFTFEPVIRPVA